MDVVIITGMSGSGKKTTAHILEDIGYYCIDNMPISLIESFFDIYKKNPEKNTLVSFTLDIRAGDDINNLLDVVKKIKESGINSCRILYLDATDEVLIRRYKETRHIHPLVRSMGISLENALEIERSIVSKIEKYADFTIDTSNLRVPELKEHVNNLLRIPSSNKFIVSCISFGYKYGMPHDLDLAFDVRCLPNPFYIASLKDFTGLDKCVCDYIFSFDCSNELIIKLTDLIDFLLPYYIKEGKSNLSIGIGCTGGKHRSVAVAESIYHHLLNNSSISSSIIHRDINK